MQENNTKEKTKNGNRFYWGLKPNPTLESFINSIPEGKALDLGGGEGKNSFFLAQNGFEVETVDKNSQSLEKCQNFADQHKLQIQTILSNIKGFDLKEGKYTLIISTAALDFLKKSEIEPLVKKMKKALHKNGYIFLMVFSSDDPMYQKIISIGLKEIEENTFYLPKFKIHRHFFTLQELKEMFQDLKIIYLEQRKIKDIGHGKSHFHNVIEILAQKTD